MLIGYLGHICSTRLFKGRCECFKPFSLDSIVFTNAITFLLYAVILLFQQVDLITQFFYLSVGGLDLGVLLICFSLEML